MRYSFSGHESFQCKSLWLKKGFDFVMTGKSFNDDYAVVELGVGKNMVSAIKYWLKSFGLIDEVGALTQIARYLLDNNGKDPYLEDIGSLWLLHYHLVTTQVATLYNLVFTEFNHIQRAFSKAQLYDFVKRWVTNHKSEKITATSNTLTRDISTLLKNYVRPNTSKALDDFSAVLLNLNLIRRLDGEYFEFASSSQGKLDPFIFLYAILSTIENNKPSEAKEDTIVDYNILLNLASIFGMSINDLNDTIREMIIRCPEVSYYNAAGEQLFSIKGHLDKWSVLDRYYAQAS